MGLLPHCQDAGRAARILNPAMSAPPPPPRRRDAPGVGGAPPPPPPPPDREAREARRAEETSSSQRRWWLTIISGVLAIALIAVVALVLMKNGDDKPSEPEFEASTAVDLKVGQLQVVSPQGGENAFPSEIAEELLALTGQYVDEGIVVPLRKGAANDEKLGAIFDLAALNRLATDRAVLVDEGFPEAVGKVSVTAPPVNFLALASGPSVLLVTGAVDLTVKARLADGTATIHRMGTFVFAKQQSGEWRITGWTMHVDRTGPGVATTTTAATTPTTVAAG